MVVHAADIQDRDGAPAVLKSILKRWPWLRHVFADGSDLTAPKASRSCHALGRGANLRMAGQMPKAGKGLRAIHRIRKGMGLHRPYPAPYPQALKGLKTNPSFQFRH